MKRREFLLRLIALTCVSLGIFACSPSTDVVTLKLGHLADEKNIWHLASLRFAEEVGVLTEGRVQIEVYPNESLGKEIDLINGMQLGTVDLTISGESLQNWAPMAALLAVPYAYSSLEQMDTVANGEIGAGIEKQILERANVRPLAYFARGPRNLTASRPISGLDDLSRLKLRVPNVPLFIDVWKGLGAQPTPMAFSEVFTSLQNGTIDAQENPLALIRSAHFDEVQSHVIRTEHVRSWIYLVVSELSWQKLSDDDKEAVKLAASRAQAFERQLFLAEEQSLTEELEGKGMTFVDVDKSQFASAARAAVLANVDEEIKPIVESLLSD